MFSLRDKVAVVTGASSGIGRAIAERFLACGAQVHGMDRLPAGSEPFPVVQVDVSDLEALGRAFESVVAATGGVDILVNNAGIQPLGVTFDALTPALIERTLAVNVSAVIWGHTLAARLMRPGGRIINTGSFVGTVGVPGGSVYAVSKAAIVHLTRLAAVELAPRGITVNCVCPGTIRTPAVMNIPDNPEIPFVSARTPLGRLGEPDEVAAAFHFLATDEASYITGAILPVDGGISAGWERYDLGAPQNFQNGEWHDG